MTTADHTRLVNDCLKATEKTDIMAWRNDVGAGYVLSHKQMELLIYLISRNEKKSAMNLLKNLRYIRYGLDVGSSDIISLIPTLIKPNMVNKIIGAFGAFECKTGKAVASKKQKTFINAINKKGGVAFVVRDAGEIECNLDLTSKK